MNDISPVDPNQVQRHKVVNKEVFPEQRVAVGAPEPR